jgi:hypothetical protein
MSPSTINSSVRAAPSGGRSSQARSTALSLPSQGGPWRWLLLATPLLICWPRVAERPKRAEEGCHEEAVYRMRQVKILYKPSIVAFPGGEKDGFTTVKEGFTYVPLAEPWGELPLGTRLYGRLYLAGRRRLHGTFVEAYLPGGRVIPICVHLRNDFGLGVPLEEWSTEESLVLRTEQQVRVFLTRFE